MLIKIIPVLTRVGAHSKCSKERREERKREKERRERGIKVLFLPSFYIASKLFLLSNNHNLPYIKRLVLENHYRDYKYLFPYHNSYIYTDFCFVLFLAVLGLRCCVQAFSSGRERGLLFLAVRRFFIAVAFLVVEQGL